METLVLVIHTLIALGLVVLVMMQQGKGADMGAAFGSGASQTLFGSAGSGSVLTRLTSGLAFAFFITSFSLAVFAKQKAEQSLDTGIPFDAAIPTIETTIDPQSSDVPLDLSQPEALENSSASDLDVPELDATDALDSEPNEDLEAVDPSTSTPQ